MQRSGFRAVVATVDPGAAVLAVIVLVSAGAWGLSLGDVDLGKVSDLGLVTAMPPLMIASMALIAISFGFAVSRARLSPLLLGAHLLLGIVMIYALPALVEPLARFSVSWRHVGIAEVLSRTGEIDPTVSAYFNWPGFFALTALFTDAMGLPDATPFLAWAPVAFNILYLPPLVLLYRALTRDARVIWLAIFIFYVADWIGQDYFSPQALGLLLSLWILAIILTWMPGPPLRGGARWTAWFRPDEARGVSALPFHRASAIVVAVILFGVLVFAHQLSPFAVVAATLALVIAGRIRSWTLPVLMIVLLGGWLSYMTVAYLSGHIHQLLANLGSVDTAVTAGVTDRFRGSPDHLIVLAVRAGTTILLWGTAALGIVLRLRNGYRDMTVPLLAAVPFTLVALQSYGGEVLLRVFLFSLPFMALLGAWAIVLAFRAWPTMPRGAATGICLLILLAGSFLSRYGNERMDILQPDELAGMEAVYELSPDGAVLVAVAENVFWQFRDYERYRYRLATDAIELSGSKLERELFGASGDAAYIILSRSQRASVELLGGHASAEWDALERRIANLAGVTKLFDNGAVRLYRYLPEAGTS